MRTALAIQISGSMEDWQCLTGRQRQHSSCSRTGIASSSALRFSRALHARRPVPRGARRACAAEPLCEARRVSDPPEAFVGCLASIRFLHQRQLHLAMGLHWLNAVLVLLGGCRGIPLGWLRGGALGGRARCRPCCTRDRGGGLVGRGGEGRGRPGRVVSWDGGSGQVPSVLRPGGGGSLGGGVVDWVGCVIGRCACSFRGGRPGRGR